MQRSATQLRADALAIWRAGVAGVQSEQLMQQQVRVEKQWLVLDEFELDLRTIRRIVVVGAGKAGAGMAAGLEAALGPKLLAEKQVTGWVNVPADCARPLQRITLHPARPAGVNEPTAAGVAGSERILQLVSGCGAEDLCLVLLSGGGSALLPAPVEGITLEDKLSLTRQLSAAGANIYQLNTVRKQLSRIKGGALARACRAGRMVSLIISDVIGDPLDLIASGPTVPDTSTPQEAWDILQKFGEKLVAVPESVWPVLQTKIAADAHHAPPGKLSNKGYPHVANFILANLATAVDCAGVEAERRGYSYAMLAAKILEGDVENIGRDLAQKAMKMSVLDGPDCLIMGGEGTVQLVGPSLRGKGGRNQQTVLAAWCELAELCGQGGKNPAVDLVILSGGTDGEDGPTDAAGAWLDEEVANRARQLGLDPAAALARNDAYPLFEQAGGLLITGPTHTNVCDLRVVVVNQL
ncbi:MAG: DUF4147 domain-containing protein [Pirellulales bacterium]|nr:DUF4147 domain-containing protein [Pirellulales bacterium]